MKARKKLTKQQNPLKTIQISGYSCDSLLNENPMKTSSPSTSQPPRSDFFFTWICETGGSIWLQRLGLIYLLVSGTFLLVGNITFVSLQLVSYYLYFDHCCKLCYYICCRYQNAQKKTIYTGVLICALPISCAHSNLFPSQIHQTSSDCQWWYLAINCHPQ